MAKSDIEVKVTADTSAAERGLTGLGTTTTGLTGIFNQLVSRIPVLNRMMGPNGIQQFAGQGASGVQGLAAAGGALVAGGAAVFSFLSGANEKFVELAKTAIDGAAATGLSTEQFSRWAAVADDAGLSAADLQTGVGKIAKSLDSGKWERYGIATRDASGNVRDANDVFLDALDLLGKTTNKTEQARIGNDLFGKGYANLAPLIGGTRRELEGMLGQVEKGQVITAKEAKKAEEMRLAQDALSDAFDEVTLAVGGLTASLAPLIQGMSEVLPLGISFIEKVGKPMGDVLNVLGQLTRDVTGDMAEYKDGLEVTRLRAEEYNEALVAQHERLWEANKEQREAAEALEESQGKAARLRDRANELADAHRRGTEHLREYRGELDELTGNLDNEQAFLNLTQQIDDVGKAAFDTQIAMNEGTITAEEGMRRQALAVNSLKQDVIAYGQQLELTPDQITTLIKLVDNGEIEAMEQRLAILARNRTASLSIVAKGGVGYDGGLDGKKAAGGPVAAGGTYLVGENGPEILQMGGSSGNVIPNHKIGAAAGNTYVTINALRLDERDVRRAIARDNRRNGR